MKRKPCWKNTGRQCAIWRWHKSPNWLGLKNFKTIKSRRTHTHDYTCACVCVPVQIICIQCKHNVRLVPSSWGFNQQKCLRIRQKKQHTHPLAHKQNGVECCKKTLTAPREPLGLTNSNFRFSLWLLVGSDAQTCTDMHTLVYYNRNKTGPTKCQQLLIHNRKCDKWKSYGLPMFCINEPAHPHKHTHTHICMANIFEQGSWSVAVAAVDSLLE